MSRFLDFARLYLSRWGVASVFMLPSGTPLHHWREYADSGMTAEELNKLWWTKVQGHAEEIRLAILTGPYMSKLEKPMIIVDVDSPPVSTLAEKLELMKVFARDGYLVVNTPRGFHVHAFLSKDSKLPYIIRIEQEQESGKATGIGEGAVLMPHTWTMPPSRRPLSNSWFTYTFVYPDGTQTSSYDNFSSKPIDPAQVQFEDFVSDVEMYLRATVRTYHPMEEGDSGLKELDTDIGLKKPLFYDLEEFLATADSLVLPRCTAWVLTQYFFNTGDDYRASRVLTAQIDNEELLTLVPHGKRKLVSVAFTLFVAHVVDKVRYDEIVEILSYSLDDFPQDTVPLNKALKYFLLADKDGYVYPRYSGLGSMNLLQVLGDFCTSRCPYGRMCKGRNPWKYFRREYKKKLISRFIVEEEY